MDHAPTKKSGVRKPAAKTTAPRKSRRKQELSVLDELRWICEESLLFADERSPFEAKMVEGAGRLVIVIGENATGKSLLHRLLCIRVREAGAVPVGISIRERTGSGTGDMSRMRQAFMFGDETEQSTGAGSVGVIQTGFKNLDRPGGSILALDEPELGLSDGYARALGTYISEATGSAPDACKAVIVTTHSRALVEGILAAWGGTPTVVRTGGGTADISAWLAEKEERNVDELLALREIALDRWRATNKLIKL